MKIKNFRNLQILPSGNKIARVDVETGCWLFKKVRTEYVVEHSDGIRWYFVSSGEFVPYNIWNLYRGYTVLKEMEENAEQ